MYVHTMFVTINSMQFLKGYITYIFCGPLIVTLLDVNKTIVNATLLHLKQKNQSHFNNIPC